MLWSCPARLGILDDELSYKTAEKQVVALKWVRIMPGKKSQQCEVPLTVHECCKVFQRKGWRWSAACCPLDNSETSAPGGPPRPCSCHSRKPSWSYADSTPRLQLTWDPSNWCTPLRANADCQLQHAQLNWIYCITTNVWTEIRFSVFGKKKITVDWLHENKPNICITVF